jgi:hypothetical protein
MKNCLLIIVISFLCLSCQENLRFKTQNFQLKTKLPCKKNCAEIKMKIAVAQNKNEIADSINKNVFLVVKSIVYNEDGVVKILNYNDIMKSFIEAYNKIQTENPSDYIGWTSNVNAVVTYQSNEILNISVNHDSFTGGAHGYEGIQSLVINPKTGNRLKKQELFTDTIALKSFAEKKFKTHFKIPKDSAINSTGFMFMDEKFELPLNFFYTKKGLLFYYNNYEIASYAQGPQELLISYNDLKPYLKLK